MEEPDDEPMEESIKESLINESDFHKHHKEQVHHRSQKDIFFIWLLLMFIAMLGSFFVLNFTP